MSPSTSTSTSRPRLSQIFKRRTPSTSDQADSNQSANPVLPKDTLSNPNSPSGRPKLSLSGSLSASPSSSFFSITRTRSESNQIKPEDVGSEEPLLKIEYHDQGALDAFRDALGQDSHSGVDNQSSSSPISSPPTISTPTSTSTSISTSISTSPTTNTSGSAIQSKDLQPTSKFKSFFFPPKVSTITSNPTNNRIAVSSENLPHRISAASDFAPIRERTSKRKTKDRIDSGTREGFVYNLLRFPLLLAIFLTIFLEFMAYVGTRQIVNVIEYLTSWRGQKGSLRSSLRSSKSHSEWKEHALKLDSFMGYESWKSQDASGLYDWVLIKKVLNSLKTFRESKDATSLIGVLDLCLRDNFAGTENFRLYSETWFGTKNLIEEYLNEIERGLKFIEETDLLDLSEKKNFYRSISKNFGKSALCLSGGGSFGYYHLGVVKGLLDSNLLPKVISGTSAGGLIAALVCTRTDEELKKLLVPALADKITACEESIRIWSKRVWKTGARFDTLQFASKAQFFCCGSLTFLEAFKKTGKVLNVSVIPSDKHSPSKLLNYLTAPDCIIWSALLASAAVPGIMNPVVLMQKTQKDGKIIPWNWGHRFRDGSLRVDIPLKDLHSMFNVNFPLVSQVNPHVHLFFFAPKGMPGRPVVHRKGKGWRGGFILSAAEHVLKVHLSTNFKIMRDLDLLPSILGADWANVFLQPFSGAVTIWPKTRAWDWVRILSDPDRKELLRMMRVGEICTWPKVHMISNRMRLERAIERGRRINRSAIRAKSTLVEGGGGGGLGANSSATSQALGAILTPGGYMISDTDAEDYMQAQVRSRRGGPGLNGNANFNSNGTSTSNLKSKKSFNGDNHSFPSTLDSVDEKEINEKEEEISENLRTSRLLATLSPSKKDSNSNLFNSRRRRRSSKGGGGGDDQNQGTDDDDLNENETTSSWSRGSMSAGAGLNNWERERELDDDSDSSGAE